jgi:hypothetical protein
MKKELIIIVYKIKVAGLTRQMAEQQIHQLMLSYKLEDDEELKDDYIVREIWLPIQDGESDVKIIYPIPRYTTSPELNDLVQEITEKIKKDPTNALKQQWERLVREIKLRKIDIINEC